MALDLDSYKGIVEKYANFRDIVENFDKVHYEPQVRQMLGAEIFSYPSAFIGAGSDRVFVAAKNIEGGAREEFVEKSKGSLDELLDKLVSSEERALGIAMDLLEYDPIEVSGYEEVYKAHKKIKEYESIAESKNVDRIAQFYLEKMPQYKDAIEYFMVNNEAVLVEVFRRGHLRSAQFEYQKQFVDMPTKKGEKPVIHRDKIKDYVGKYLSKLEDDKFGEVFLPYALSLFQKKKK